MSCTCGDICCPSCGPAQGNFRCSICNTWMSEGCIHLDAQGGVLPEYYAEAEAAAQTESEADDLLVKDLAEEADLAEKYLNEISHPLLIQSDEDGID